MSQLSWLPLMPATSQGRSSMLMVGAWHLTTRCLCPSRRSSCCVWCDLTRLSSDLVATFVFRSASRSLLGS